MSAFWTYPISFFRLLPRRVRRVFFAILILFLLVQAAVWVVLNARNDKFDLNPLQFLKTQQYQRFKATKAEADAGDPQALFELAGMYRSGTGPPQSDRTAVKAYLQAAQRGHLQSRFVLGTLYARGQGVAQSYARAAEWYELAAHLGNHREAQFALANFYFNGRGVPHDYLIAIKWYRKAAGQGHPAAQYLLGTFYAEGWGVGQDYIQAYLWLSLAAREPDRVKAVKFSYTPVKSLRTLIARMTDVQIAAARRALAAWRPD